MLGTDTFTSLLSALYRIRREEIAEIPHNHQGVMIIVDDFVIINDHLFVTNDQMVLLLNILCKLYTRKYMERIFYGKRTRVPM